MNDQHRAQRAEAVKEAGMDDSPLTKAFVLTGSFPPGMMSMMKPKPVVVVLKDGTQGQAVQHFDPSTGGFAYFNGGGKDISDDVFRVVTPNAGLSISWPRVITTGAGREPVSVQMTPNGTVYTADDPTNPPEVASYLSKLRAPIMTNRSNSSTNAEGDTTSSNSQTTRGVAPPPSPPGGAPAAKPPQRGSQAPPTAHLSPEDRRAQNLDRKNVATASEKVRPMVNMLDSAENYYGSKKFDSAGDLNLVVNAVRSMNPGTVRLPQMEISMERDRGTIPEQVGRWFQKNAVNGLLPTQYRDELMGQIRRETQVAANGVAQDWQDKMGKQALPNHLKRFAAQPQQSGGNGQPLTITLPSGKKVTIE
jgi:hypothetical protein